MLLCIFLLKNNISRFISSFFLNDIKKPPVCDIMKLTRNQNITLRGGFIFGSEGAGISSRKEPLCYGYMIPQKS